MGQLLGLPGSLSIEAADEGNGPNKVGARRNIDRPQEPFPCGGRIRMAGGRSRKEAGGAAMDADGLSGDENRPQSRDAGSAGLADEWRSVPEWNARQLSANVA